MNSIAYKYGSGQAVSRIEDVQLLKGLGQYADDVVHAGQTFLSFVRSPHAHANISGIDTTAAQQMPGVLAVYTAQDMHKLGVKPMAKPVNFKRADGSPIASATRTILASDRVRFVGETVVAVVASSPEAAKNACEAVVVDYEPLACAVTLQDALAKDAPLLADVPDNVVAETRYGDHQACQGAFATAAHVVSLDITHQRLIP